MCRNIKTLFNFEPPAADKEIKAASLQYVRKITGFTKPSRVNEADFYSAGDDIARSAAGRRRGAPRGRDRLPQAVQGKRGGLLLRGRRHSEDLGGVARLARNHRTAEGPGRRGGQSKGAFGPTIRRVILENAPADPTLRSKPYGCPSLRRQDRSRQHVLYTNRRVRCEVFPAVKGRNASLISSRRQLPAFSSDACFSSNPSSRYTSSRTLKITHPLGSTTRTSSSSALGGAWFVVKTPTETAAEKESLPNPKGSPNAMRCRALYVPFLCAILSMRSVMSIPIKSS